MSPIIYYNGTYKRSPKTDTQKGKILEPNPAKYLTWLYIYTENGSEKRLLHWVR